jgi:hypothetical protein
MHFLHGDKWLLASVSLLKPEKLSQGFPILALQGKENQNSGQCQNCLKSS